MLTKNLIRELKTLRDLGHRQQVLAEHLIEELTVEGREQATDGAEIVGVVHGLAGLVEYLTARGFKCQKSKAYADRKAGLIRMEVDGRTISYQAIQDYIRVAQLKRT